METDQRLCWLSIVRVGTHVSLMDHQARMKITLVNKPKISLQTVRHDVDVHKADKNEQKPFVSAQSDWIYTAVHQIIDAPTCTLILSFY